MIKTKIVLDVKALANELDSRVIARAHDSYGIEPVDIYGYFYIHEDELSNIVNAVATEMFNDLQKDLDNAV